MKLITARRAAAELGVSYSTLKLWIHQGRVRTTQTAGGHHRVSDAEIQRLQAHRDPAGSSSRQDPPTDIVEGLSARNRLPGFVEEIRIDGLLGQVRLRIGDHVLTAVITADAIRELKLRRGDDALAIVKSTEVMIGKAGRAPTEKGKEPGAKAKGQGKGRKRKG